MGRSGMKLSVSIGAGIAILLGVTGCADFRMPRIDPTGEHLLICDSPPPAAVTCPPGTIPSPAATTCPPGTVPAPAPAAASPRPIAAGVSPSLIAGPPVVSPYSDVAAMLSPFRTVAPVGSQVVMLAGVRGGDNYLRTNRRLEWWLMPGSVGQFTAIGEHDFTDFLVGDFTRPRLLSPTSAVGSTTRVPQRAGRPPNTVYVASGQGWVTVSSPVEGISQVMVVAPDVVLPDQRSKSATIYWIDVQFGLPTPAIVSAGAKQSLTTTVWRQSNHFPRAGWIVRYEAVCGPPVVFAPSGTPSIEAATNEAGQASVEIVQKDPSPGTSQVRVQVYQPADSCGQRLLVRETSVLVTWTAPSLGIRQAGPATAPPGEPITYRIEVSNPGDSLARDVVASEVVPDGLEFLQATPAPVVDGRRLQWRLGDLAPRQSQIIEAIFRTTRPGVISHCVEVTGAGGLRSSHCASTTVRAAIPGPATIVPPATIPPLTVAPPGPGPTPRAMPAATSVLDLKVAPETPQVTVGDNVTFDIDLTNRGPAAATGLVFRDTFGDGLEHQQRSPITRALSDLAPGQSARIGLTFRVTRVGQLCHKLEVAAANGARATADSCVTAVAPAGRAVPAPATPSPGTAVIAPPSSPASVPMEIHVSCPATATVGKSVVFTAEITNPGKQPVANVVVSQQADAALVATQASEGAVRKGNELVWTLSSVPPGRPIRLQVQCDCKQPASKACCHFTVTPSGGQAIDGFGCLEIAAATPPAATPGQLSVRVDNLNKVTAGKNQQFLVQITNLGDSVENDVIVTAHLPPGSTADPFGTAGPSPDVKFERERGLVRFSAWAELQPKATLNYRVAVTTSQPGPISLRVEATSRRQTQPAVGEKTVEVLPAE